MKASSNVVFLFRDSGGLATAIYDSFHPNPTNNSSSLTSLEEPFELSLERYGIKDVKASGTVLHFIDPQGFYQVSFFLMQNNEPPVLACAVNEVLSQISGEESSPLPTIMAPFFVSSSKLKRDGKPLTKSENKVPIYGVQIGPGNDITKVIATRTEKLSCSAQVHHEPLACLLQLARALHLPTFILIGEKGHRVSNKIIEDLEIIHEMGEILAASLNLCFSKDQIKWNPKGQSKNSEEPWRALYG